MAESTLPPELAAAIDDLVKNAEQFGYAAGTGNELFAQRKLDRLRAAKRRLEQSIEREVSRLYQSGIEIGQERFRKA